MKQLQENEEIVSSTKWKRKRSNDKTQDSSPVNERRWENLDLDILNKIFAGVTSFDLLHNISLVCRSWQLGCWSRLFWVKDVLDLSVMEPILGIVRPNPNWGRGLLQVEKNDKAVATKLTKLLKSVMDGYEGYGFSLEHWRLSIRTVHIPDYMKILDHHLAYIAERTTGLESLTLLGSLKITGSGFAKATPYWRNVKFIDLGQIRSPYVCQAIEEIGKNCSSLESLFMTVCGFHLRQENASLITKSLQQAKIVDFHAAFLHKDGVNCIFSNPLGPKVIRFFDCFLMNDEPRNPEGAACYDNYHYRGTFTLKRSDEKWHLVAYRFKNCILKWMNDEKE